MTKNNELQKWLTVASGFAFFFMMMGLISNCFSLYIIPITTDLGFTRGQFSIAQTMIFAAGIVCSLTAPKIYKKFGIIRVIRTAVVVCSVTYFLESYASSLWQFYICSFISGFCMQLTTTMPMALLIGEWFTEKKNMAISISALGSGVGGSILNLTVSKIITTLGWRYSFRYLGIACLIVSSIPAFLLLKRHPDALAKEEAEKKAAKEVKTEKKKGQVAPVAYKFAIVSVLMNITGCTIMYTTIPYIQDIGFSATFAAGVSSASMIALAFGKFIHGVCLDKLGFRKCFLITQLSGIFGMAVLIFFKASPSLMLYLYYAAVLFSCSYGSVGIPAAAEYVSKGINKSETMGVIMAFGSFGGAISSAIAGYVYDFTGSYVPMFYGLAVLLVAAIVISNIILNSVK